LNFPACDANKLRIRQGYTSSITGAYKECFLALLTEFSWQTHTHLFSFPTLNCSCLLPSPQGRRRLRRNLLRRQAFHLHANLWADRNYNNNTHSDFQDCPRQFVNPQELERSSDFSRLSTVNSFEHNPTPSQHTQSSSTLATTAPASRSPGEHDAADDHQVLTRLSLTTSSVLSSVHSSCNSSRPFSPKLSTSSSTPSTAFLEVHPSLPTTFNHFTSNIRSEDCMTSDHPR